MSTTEDPLWNGASDFLFKFKIPATFSFVAACFTIIISRLAPRGHDT